MSIKWKVAVVDGNRRVAREIVGGLGVESYSVRGADSASTGLDLVRHWNPDVVLLDPTLPDGDGPALFERFRAETDAVIVGMSNGSSPRERVAGLKAGADDYLMKPFDVEELVARVEAIIRRHRGKGSSRLMAEDVVVDFSEGQATRGGLPLGLTAIEFRILCALMRSVGQLVTYPQLAEAVWAVASGPDSNSLEVHISRIRQKMETGARTRLIHTVRGLGYRFSTDSRGGGR